VKEITDALLRKADRSIAVAKKLFPSEADFAAARAYYAMFYIASGMGLAAGGQNCNFA
jgi:uncharacterized protein (UPF0332 family)